MCSLSLRLKPAFLKCYRALKRALSTIFLHSSQYENLRVQPLIVFFFFLILLDLLRIPISSLPPFLFSYYLACDTLACDCRACQTKKPRDLASIWSRATAFQDFQIFSVARFWQIHFALYNFIRHEQIRAFTQRKSCYLLLCVTQILYFAKNKRASQAFKMFHFNGYFIACYGIM